MLFGLLIFFALASVRVILTFLENVFGSCAEKKILYGSVDVVLFGLLHEGNSTGHTMSIKPLFGIDKRSVKSFYNWKDYEDVNGNRNVL